MELKNEILLRKYDAALKVAEDCRKREVSLINYSMIIYGAVFGFVATNAHRIESIVQFFAMVFLCLLMGIIGLYIAKVNIVELKHFEMEKKVYKDNNIGLDDYNNWPHPGLNKFLLMLTYLILILFALLYSFYILPNNMESKKIILICDSSLRLYYCLYYGIAIKITWMIISIIAFIGYYLFFNKLIKDAHAIEKKSNTQ